MLDVLGYTEADVRPLEVSMAEKIARFITNPFVYSILLTIGILGLVLELFSPGFGFPGLSECQHCYCFFMDISSRDLRAMKLLYYLSSESSLYLLEFFISGGIAGILGFVAIIASFFLAADNVSSYGNIPAYGHCRFHLDIYFIDKGVW